MKLQINQLHINNFKGIKNLTVNFNEKITNIYGDNGTGKSTVFDAFCYLLFDKDSSDRKTFNIKNTVNTELNETDHIVSAEFIINGFKERPKKVYREKWVKKTSDEGKTFDGHETVYYWNDVPMKAGEYKTKVDTLVKEETFKTLTNVLFFNENYTWQKRRDILIHLVGGFLSDEEIAGTNKDYVELLNKITTENKTMEGFKSEVVEKRKKYKDEVKNIEPRIAEIYNNIPEEQEWEELNAKIDSLSKEVDKIDKTFQDVSEKQKTINEEKQAKQKQLFNAKSLLSELKFTIEQGIKREARLTENDTNKYVNNLEGAENKLKYNQTVIDSVKKQIEILTNSINELTAKWTAENAKSLPEVTEFCPTCDQQIPDDIVDQKRQKLKDNFNNNLLSVKAAIEESGKRLNAQRKEENERLVSLEKEHLVLIDNVAKAKIELEGYKAPKQLTEDEISKKVNEKLSTDNDYLDSQKLIISLENEISGATSVTETFIDPELKLKRTQFQNEIADLNKLLGTQSVIEQNKTRIEQLKASEKKISQELADLEKFEFLIDGFNRKKIESLEERINNKFQFVSFKMFNVLVNGGLEDTCETIMEGKPWSTMNTALKINAGLDIINTLSTKYTIFAPIFIDNKESISKLIPVESQLILLSVSEDDKVLRIV
jgi:exonuclease SbcC